MRNSLDCASSPSTALLVVRCSRPARTTPSTWSLRRFHGALAPSETQLRRARRCALTTRAQRHAAGGLRTGSQPSRPLEHAAPAGAGQCCGSATASPAHAPGQRGDAAAAPRRIHPRRPAERVVPERPAHDHGHPVHPRGVPPLRRRRRRCSRPSAPRPLRLEVVDIDGGPALRALYTDEVCPSSPSPGARPSGTG